MWMVLGLSNEIYMKYFNEIGMKHTGCKESFDWGVNAPWEVMQGLRCLRAY